MGLRAFFRWRGRDCTASIRVIDHQGRPRAPYSQDELRRLLAACERPRDRAFLLTFVSTGARFLEVLSARVEDIDWQAGTLWLRRTKGDRPRMVALGGIALAALREHCGDQRSFSGGLWPSQRGGNLTRAGAQAVLRRIARRAGVPRAGFHRFRVTYAVRFASETGDLDALRVTLGHRSLSMSAWYASYNVAERALAIQRRLADVPS